jgi:uncharacterized membrane protein YdjX (TVP38/TMEM64 family)
MENNPSMQESKKAISRTAKIAGLATGRERYLRLGLLVFMLILLYVIGRRSGLLAEFTVDRLHQKVDQAGTFGVLLFLAVFAFGLLIHGPGQLFIALGIVAYGKLIGFFVTLAGAIISVSVSFLIVRFVGGRALAGVERPFFRRILAKLDERPMSTVMALRCVFWTAPTLNYTLALTNIRFLDYFIGSAVGLLVPVLLFTALYDRLLAYLRS